MSPDNDDNMTQTSDKMSLMSVEDEKSKDDDGSLFFLFKGKSGLLVKHGSTWCMAFILPKVQKQFIHQLPFGAVKHVCLLSSMKNWFSLPKHNLCLVALHIFEIYGKSYKRSRIVCPST